METAKYLCEFFFNDFWHFVMLILVCLSLSPKINTTVDSPTTVDWSKKDDI